MGCKKITVRFDKTMYDKIRQDDRSNSDIIRKAVGQYYRLKEDNNRLNPAGHTGSYDTELINVYKNQVEMYKNQVEELRIDKHSMQSSIQEKDHIIYMQSLGWIGRFKLMLESKKQ